MNKPQFTIDSTSISFSYLSPKLHCFLKLWRTYTKNVKLGTHFYMDIFSIPPPPILIRLLVAIFIVYSKGKKDGFKIFKR